MAYDEDDPCRLLSIASQMLKRRADRSLSEFNLTLSQFLIIMNIYENENSNDSKHNSPADLAENMSCERPTVTGLIDRLEKQGFVARVPNPDDRRSSNIVLTDKARKPICKMARMFNENKVKALEGFDGQETANLYDYLKRIISNLEGNRDSRVPVPPGRHKI